jgi:hypothetical protein
MFGADMDGPECKPKGSAFLRGVDVDNYDIDGLRKWYDIFSDMVATEEAFDTSACMLEGYSVQGVQAVPEESTAFPHRHQRLLLYVCGSPPRVSDAGKAPNQK